MLEPADTLPAKVPPLAAVLLTYAPELLPRGTVGLTFALTYAAALFVTLALADTKGLIAAAEGVVVVDEEALRLGTLVMPRGVYEPLLSVLLLLLLLCVCAPVLLAADVPADGEE